MKTVHAKLIILVLAHNNPFRRETETNRTVDARSYFLCLCFGLVALKIYAMVRIGNFLNS